MKIRKHDDGSQVEMKVGMFAVSIIDGDRFYTRGGTVEMLVTIDGTDILPKPIADRIGAGPDGIIGFADDLTVARVLGILAGLK